MNPATLIDSLGWTLLHFLWQGCVIAAATAVSLRVLRRADPVYRYNVACVGLLGCLLWPAAELWMRLQDSDAARLPLHLSDALLIGRTDGAAGGLLVFLQQHLLWIVGFWAACAVVLALRMALGLVWIGRSSRVQSGDVRLQASVTRLARQFGITRAVRLRVVENLSSPLTAGWLRPLILVPASLASGMPHELLEALLAHEIAHVKRFDYLVNLGQNVIEILLFYHPAVWWISGRVRDEREQIADDIAARQTGEPRVLARALSELEKLQFSHQHLALAANGGHLVGRVRRLLRPDTQVLNWKAALPILGLAAACMSMYVHASTRSTIAAAAFPTRPPVLDFKSCAKPNYPAQDLAAAHQGTATLGFDIDPHGRVVRSRVASSSGFASMDMAALNALRLCTFKPALQNGKAVQSPVQVQYVWTLE